MKIAGHTMGTPELTVEQAIDLFAELGLDGAEIICVDNYRCGITLQTPHAELQNIRRRALDRGVTIAGLVPYMKDLNVSDQEARERAISEFKRAVDIAAYLECPAIRVFGGHEVSASEREAALHWLADSLHIIGEYAQPAGVKLNIENHMDTMATSAAATMEIVHEVELGNVGVIYDQGNLSFMGQEEHEQAILLQWPSIDHVHVKDFFWRDGERFASVLGDGVVPWAEIVTTLSNLGYDGFYSLEYERRWFPDQLPPAEIGMKRSAEFLQRVIS